MKKTIIALMALAGSVFATETDSVSVLSTDIKKDLTLANVESSASLTMADVTLQGWKADGSSITNFGSMSTGEHLKDYLRPDVNVGNGGAWTLTFSLTNSGSESITLDSCALDMIMFDSKGNAQSNQVTRAISYTLTATRADNSTVTLYSQDPVIMTGVGSEVINDEGKVTSSGTVGVDFDFTSAYTLAAGEKVTFALNIADGTPETDQQALGTFIGIKNLSLNQTIPEPTTATLSLLALAGLAARRRRASR